jgi:hypothetical protein
LPLFYTGAYLHLHAEFRFGAIVLGGAPFHLKMDALTLLLEPISKMRLSAHGGVAPFNRDFTSHFRNIKV